MNGNYGKITSSFPPAWQNVTSKKRKISSSLESGKSSSSVPTQNSFSTLMIESDNQTNGKKETLPKDPKPPPIFIPKLNNYKDMIEEISSLVDKEVFTAKLLANGAVRVNANTVYDYCKIVEGL